MFAKALVAVAKCVDEPYSKLYLSLLLVTVYFSSGLKTQVGTILKLSTT